MFFSASHADIFSSYSIEQQLKVGQSELNFNLFGDRWLFPEILCPHHARMTIIAETVLVVFV